jgi:hypothetical protein
MKRVFTVFSATLLGLVLAATPALADYPPSSGPGVKGEVVHAGKDLAFTGSNISPVLMIGAALLLVLGVTLFVFGRRYTTAHQR